ncbi:PAS domain-containing protein [Polyangium mundeleinium]|uniref:PAS domain-containing protein n=1 Tax=Polyangium mundeleinium TaxID=2995306 RepID=A0ABT5ET50_9BACT|nr:PAS domain-containing protein [Polyangium mundeleinium]MDC0744087.1 PAS domain-containing protein [Polyangium mundeleinium]
MDGSEIAARADVSRLEARVVELEREITEGKERERRLVESEQRFRWMVDGSDDGGWDWDLRTNEAFMSPSWFEMLGLTPGEMPCNAETWSALMHPDDAGEVWKMLQSFLEGRLRTYHLEYRMRHKSNGWVWVMSRAKVFVRDADGKPIRMAGTLRDITERKQMEEERARLSQSLIEAQRAALLELSTPLIPIADGVVLLPLIGAMDPARAEHLLCTLLAGVEQHGATTVILDVTGVRVVDAAVADALVRASRAIGLLGARAVITGMRPEVARTLVEIGADLGAIVLLSSLRSGVEYALGRAAPRASASSGVHRRVKVMP